MRLLLLGTGAALILLHVLQRLVWLVPGRLGWLFYLTNAIGEIGPKRLGLKRGQVDPPIALAGILLLALAGIPLWITLLVATTLLGLNLHLLLVERGLLTGIGCSLDSLGIAPTDPERTHGLVKGYPAPSTHPLLSFTLLGPFSTRTPKYSLGTLLSGRRFELELIIGNHALLPMQSDLLLRVVDNLAVVLLAESTLRLSRLKPGEIHRLRLPFEARALFGKGQLRLEAVWGDQCWSAYVTWEKVTRSLPVLTHARVTRYPGACRSAFAWRGDMDLYDSSSSQSVEGLEITLGMAARYRMPQSLYLSTRLSLDVEEATRWSAHYGVERDGREIPRFILWMNEKVDLVHRAGYPFESQKSYLLELGNHGHIHYGTDASGAEGNGWATHCWIGDGRYPWLSDERGSLAEQRDNALETRRQMELHFGYSPRSWAMPSRVSDSSTPAAVEAAGCEVLSDSDVRTRDNVLRQPPPHFVPGTANAVELTKRYPGDPMHLLHYWMNLFWVHRALRKGIPVVFMCHQHMRLFDGWAGPRLTEATLRYLLHSFSGEFWINTVYGIGVYWRDVLSERARITVVIEGQELVVRNASELDFEQVPFDMEFADGSCCTLLLDLPSGCERRANLLGGCDS